MMIPQDSIPLSVLEQLVDRSEERTKKLMCAYIRRKGWKVGRIYARKEKAVFLIREAYFIQVKQDGNN